MKTDKYRVGIVGLSGISAMRGTQTLGGSLLADEMSSGHVSAYDSVPETDIVAVCELKQDYIDKFADDWGDKFPDANPYTDYREMISRENLDILSVVTSDDRHTDIVVCAAENGIKRIICEKPLATTVEDCTKMIDICDANGVTMNINHTRRFLQPYHVAKKAINEGAIGKVKRIVAGLGGPRAMLFRNGTHLIDGVVFFADSDPDWVFAELDEGHENYAVYSGDGGRDPAGDPGGSGYIHFKNGVRAFINASKGQQPAEWLQIIGEEGQINLSGAPRQKVIHRPGPAKGGQVNWKTIELTYSDYKYTGLSAAIKEIINVSNNGGQVTSPASEAKKTVDIIIGFLKSQESGNKRINLS